MILKSYCNNTNNNCHNKLTTITITQQQQEVGVLILLILGFEQLSAAPPAVFDDYFEQDVKVAASLDFVAHFVADLTLPPAPMMFQAVHLTQRGVIKACLPENKWTQLLAKYYT